jgi:molybdopterin molybdotransferase
MAAPRAHQPRYRVDTEEALRLILEHMPRYPGKKVPLDQARGAVLRQRVIAERDQPPFDRVTMDGIAISYAAIELGQRAFSVLGTQGAGEPARTLGETDTCIEIMTGAVLPAGADTVIPVERVRRTGDRLELEPGYEPARGQFIHRQGSDHRGGQALLETGVLIGPPEMAILTISGAGEVEIAHWPSVAVVSTGDELVEPGQAIEPFQIRSSNDRAIEAALRQRGYPLCTRAWLPDEPERLLREIARLHAGHDVLVLSGGVSMGKYDYVPQILAELGVTLVLHKILQRPGLPMWFGVSADKKPVFALPGNPVSTLVCFARYVLPALQHAMGRTAADRPRVKLAEAFDFKADLTCFLPVKLCFGTDGEITAIPKPTNTSGDFVSLGGTDGFVELARERQHFPAGFAAPLYRW